MGDLSTVSDAELLARVNPPTVKAPSQLSDEELLARVAGKKPKTGSNVNFAEPKKETLSWRQGKPETVWDKISQIFPDRTAAEAAKATNSLVYSEMFNISPSKAYDFHDEISQQVQDKLSTEKVTTTTRGIKGAVQSGVDNSLVGMMRKRQVPEPFESVSSTERFVSGMVSLGLDLPFFIAGAAIGGGPIAGPAGAFGFHSGMRQMLVDRYKNGEVKSFSELMERIKNASLETIKGEVVGGFTAGMGEMAGPLWKTLSPGAASPVGWKALNELATMTAVGKLIEGEIPTAKDFVDNAAMLLAIHAGTKGKAKVSEIKDRLQQKYVDQGVHPKTVVEEVLNDPNNHAATPIEQAIDRAAERVKEQSPKVNEEPVTKEEVKPNEPKEAVQTEAKVKEETSKTPPESAVSIKNAAVDAEREAMGQPPIERPIRPNDPNWEASVQKQVDRGDINPRRIAEKINNLVEAEEPVPGLTPHENYALEYDKARLTKERRVLSRQLEELESRNAPAMDTEPLKYRISEINEAIDANQRATTALGTSLSDSFRLRQDWMGDDFSIVAMEQRAKDDGVEVTPKLKAKLDGIAKDIAKAKDDLDNFIDDANAGKVEEVVKIIRKKEGLKKRTTLRVEEAKRLDDEFQSLVDQFKKVSKDTGETGAFSWKKKDKASTTDLLTAMARNRIQKGIIKAEDIIDSIYTTLSANGFKINRREIRDAISQYGEIKKMSQEPTDVALREAKRQWRLLSAYEDAKNGEIPRTSGWVRDAESERVRELRREVVKAMRDSGIDFSRTKSQEQRWKTALDSIKTRLNNEINDLSKAIDEHKPIETVKGMAVKYDEEATALRKTRDELKKAYDEVFGEKTLSPEKRVERALKALDLIIEYRERQVKSGNVEPPKKMVDKDVENDPRVKEKRKQLEELKGKVQELREKNKEHKTAEQKSIERQKKALEKEIENLKSEILTNADRSIPKPKYTNEEIEALKAERDKLRETKKSIRDQEEYEMTPDEKALSDYGKLLEKQIEAYEKKTDEGIFFRKANNELPPLTKKELDLRYKLENAKEKYAEARANYLIENYGTLKKAGYYVKETLNLSRALKTSFDLSAVLRQGGFIVLSHPFRGLQSFPAMFKALRSPEGQFAIEEEIRRRPNYPLYEKHKLFLSGHGGTLARMEEAYMSRWAGKLPGVGASERAYVTFLNKLRADSFDAMYKSWSKKGKLSDAEGNALAEFVNVATGRGAVIGESHSSVTNALVNMNSVFFAPRFVLSRFQLALGQPMWKGTARTRLNIAKEYGRYLTGVGIVLFLGMAAGADIGLYPKSSSFLGMKWGNTEIDPLSGITQATVLMSRLATGEKTTLSGETYAIRGEEAPYGKPKAWEVISSFLRGKLSPVVGAAVDVITGTDIVGNKVGITDVPGKVAFPLSFGDIYQAMADQGVPAGMALSLVGLFGMGMYTYQDRED